MEQTILINGKIYLERDRFASALLVENGRIAAVGDSADLLAQAPEAAVYDCGGRTVIPGLNDSHLHLLHIADQLARVDICGCTSVEDLISRCKAFLAENPKAREQGLHSVGWNQDLFDVPRIPTRHDLDRIATDIPIVLERICGHILTTNTRAIELLGLTADSPQYAGGTFEFGEDGQPNGIFTENACRYAVDLIPSPSIEEQEALLLRTMDYAVAHGLTSVQSNDAGTSRSAAMGPQFFEMMRQIYARGAAPLRYRHQVCFQHPDQFAQFLRSGEREHPAYQGDSWLTMGPLKLFKDGSL
ncbi:MAG: amidohydrolase family protein, partial [Clostridia bacterium]|nr:amidohydrolase family protein [Clostridia bacterium]